MLAFLFPACCSSLLPLIPYPTNLVLASGIWRLTRDASIAYNPTAPGASDVAAIATERLRTATGFPLPTATTAPTSGLYFTHQPELTTPGSYTLNIDAFIVRIGAANRTGFFYGLQTFLQLLPSDILLNKTTVRDWTTPSLSILDSPRFRWRGIMVDVSRHFQSITTIKKLLDNMARYKLNVFHFHLTDDQGWRVESKRFPNLAAVGSLRDSSPVHWDRDQSDGERYGPYCYSQEEIRDLIAYARAREITIVPEIEMPGHSLAALAGYPQYSCTGGPFRPLTHWGVQPDIFCAGNDATIAFLEALLDEMLTLFDSEYIHTGGDEAPHDRWEVCPKCRARMASLGLQSTAELQSWFTSHFARYLSERGRRLIGWDEILQGGLAEGTAVMSWRGTSGGETAAELGHEVVMTPTTHMYLDYAQFGGDDPYEYGLGLAPIHNVYNYDPTANIKDQHKKFVIGVQGNLWSEYVWGQNDLEWKIWPRAAAVAEIAWTPAKDWGRFVAGFVQVEAARLANLGINAAGIASGVAATWNSGEIAAQWVTMQWTVTGAVDEVGEYQIAFVYTSGQNDLYINNVQLYVNGLLAGADNHEGIAGKVPRANIYSVWSMRPALVGKVWVTANVSCPNGSDSAGSILVYCI